MFLAEDTLSANCIPFNCILPTSIKGIDDTMKSACCFMKFYVFKYRESIGIENAIVYAVLCGLASRSMHPDGNWRVRFCQNICRRPGGEQKPLRSEFIHQMSEIPFNQLRDTPLRPVMERNVSEPLSDRSILPCCRREVILVSQPGAQRGSEHCEKQGPEL